MKKIITLSFAFLCFYQVTQACLNEYRVNSRGQVNDIYRGLPIFYRSFDLEFSRAYLKRFDLSKKETISYKHLSDAAVHLTRLGKYPQALELLQWLNKKFPNQYKIVANLGTLYEINGQLDSAYFYINQGMKLNAKSHYGSEWVHLSILKAKKAVKANPSWILYNNVLNLTSLRDTVAEHDYDKLNIFLTRIQHIVYQLEERIPFSKTPDVILANVLREVGDLLALHISIADASVAYEIGLHYDPKDQLRFKNRLAKLAESLKKHKTNPAESGYHFPDKSKYRKVNRKYLPAITTSQKIWKMLETNQGAFWFFLILSGIVGIFFIAYKTKKKGKLEDL